MKSFQLGYDQRTHQDHGCDIDFAYADLVPQAYTRLGNRQRHLINGPGFKVRTARLLLTPGRQCIAFPPGELRTSCTRDRSGAKPFRLHDDLPDSGPGRSA